MTTPVDAERAWQDLQRIRIPQERVYDEVERCATGDRRSTYLMAAIMWIYLASMGFDLPVWGTFLALAAYLAILTTLIVIYSRRPRVKLHRSRYSWRSIATFFAGGLISGGTIMVTSLLTHWLALPYGSLIQATVSAGAFVLFVGPANRWAVSPLRGRALRDRPLHPKELGR